MLACVSGTIFGRDVVPDVCKMSATSSTSARPWRRERQSAPAPSDRLAQKASPPHRPRQDAECGTLARRASSMTEPKSASTSVARLCFDVLQHRGLVRADALGSGDASRR
jgi:hypothetical protein